jgi:hypothetical protein
MNTARINVTVVFPPIPDRSCDFRATREGYEPGDPMGWGCTEAAARADLLAQEEILQDIHEAGAADVLAMLEPSEESGQ